MDTTDKEGTTTMIASQPPTYAGPDAPVSFTACPNFRGTAFEDDRCRWCRDGLHWERLDGIGAPGRYVHDHGAVVCSQPRERAVQCGRCRQTTWNRSALCDVCEALR